MPREQEEIVAAEAILVPLNYKERTYRERLDLHADTDRIEKAIEALKALGFTIAADGIMSITISGKRELFESIFQIKLRRITPKGMDNANIFDACYYVSDENARIPKELEGVVYDVVFSMEPTFM